MRILLGPGFVKVEGPEYRVEATCSPGCHAAESADIFALLLPDFYIPIPKSGLDAALLAAVRSRLTAWNPAAAPTRKAPMPLGALFGLTALIAVGGLALAHQSIAGASAVIVPGTKIRSAPHSLGINDEHARVLNEDYHVDPRNNGYEEALIGSFKMPSAYGHYSISRYARGYTANSPDVERSSLNGPEWGVFVPPPSAEATILPQDGLLLTWTRVLDGGGTEACAAQSTYWGSIGGTGARLHPRFMRLRFCSRSLTVAELAAWLDTAGAALDADFVARTGP